MPEPRPARVQVEKSELDDAIAERSLERQQQQLPSAVFNTWYGKWAGGDKQVTKFRNPYRCNVALDSGYTKSKGPYFCIWFARGACYKGSECESLHRIPQRSDIHLINNATDCFGRTKHASYRDDMAGVGSLLQENRTLFVGYFGKEHGSVAKLVDNIRNQFLEWGNVEQVRLGKNNSIAFVTYDVEISAQFAKEAMSNQTITGKETLVVRWSRADASAKREGRSKAPLGSTEEDKIRKIVKSVLQRRREAKEAEPMDSHPIEQESSVSSSHASSGPVSAEAASRIQLLKKRKIESNSKPGIAENSIEPPQSQLVPDSGSAPQSRKRPGLVDYD